MSARILVAEDNQRQAEVIEHYLRIEGHQVQVVHDGQEALRQARQQRPDLVVLDGMMPGLDGLDVCRLLRRESSVLILMLTARSDEEDLLQGLDSGADDYLTKPYRPRELLARVRTLLRRVDRVKTDEKVLHVGGLAVDLERCTVTVDERPVDCTPAEFAILAVLADRPDRVFSRAQLRDQAQGFDREPTNRVIDTHVLNLRRKIEDDPRRPRRLVTVYGLGYKLTVPEPGLATP